MTRLGLAQYEAHATAARTEAERAAKAKALQVVLYVLCKLQLLYICCKHLYSSVQALTCSLQYVCSLCSTTTAGSTAHIVQRLDLLPVSDECLSK
jgi:hypothetical protein